MLLDVRARAEFPLAVVWLGLWAECARGVRKTTEVFVREEVEVKAKIRSSKQIIMIAF